MNVALLRVIREVRKRRELKARLSGHTPSGRVEGRGLLAVLLHIPEWYRLLSIVPLRLAPPIRYYFDSGGSSTGKTAIAVAELRGCAVKEDEIYRPPWPPSRLDVRRLVRLLVRLPGSLGVYVLALRRGKRLTHDDLQAVAVRETFMRFLRRHPHVTPIIISDASPLRMLLGSAAAASGASAIWWQEDFHHTAPPPFPVQSAAVLNEQAADGVRQRSPDVRLYGRRTPGCAPARSIPAGSRVGVAVSAGFASTAAQVGLLLRLRELLRTEELHLRLHPNSPDLGGAQDWLVTADRAELLEDFAGRMDVVLVGNSAVQLRILALGTPVIHVLGLDAQDFDLYGYVAKGIVFGTRELGPDSLHQAGEFYGTGKYLSPLSAIVGQGTGTNLRPLCELFGHLG